MIYYNLITLNAGIIYGALGSVATIVVETLIPTLFNYSIAPKVSLKIDNIQLEKKTFKNVEGYLLTALVTNKGKKIALNLDATVQIKNEQNETPKLIYVTVSKRNDSIINVKASEESFGSDKYTWINARNYESSRKWEQLRQNDNVSLHFPYVSRLGVASLDDPVNYHHSDLIKLQKNTSYEVIIEVKGENAERTTERSQAKKKIILNQ